MTRVWRIGRRAYSKTAWTGEGALRWGGRWNSPRTRVIYASSSLALAALEFFVHLEPNLAPSDLFAFAADLPADLHLERLAEAKLPPEWRQNQSKTRSIGDAWVGSATTVGLWVPSAVVPGDWNLLLNPAHPAFGRFKPVVPVPFRFDARMFSP